MVIGRMVERGYHAFKLDYHDMPREESAIIHNKRVLFREAAPDKSEFKRKVTQIRFVEPCK